MISKKILTLLLVIMTATTLLSGCGNFHTEKDEDDLKEAQDNNKLERFSDNYFDAFDTVTSLIGYSDSQETFDEMSDKIHKELIKYHRLFDIYNAYDNINNAKTINDNAGREPIEVSTELIELIELGKDIYGKTDGKVNIAMGSVLNLWHNARETSIRDPEKAYIPDIEDLKKAAMHCNIDDVIVDKEASTVFLSDSEMTLDLGAIAKGFAIECIAKKLEGEGETHFVISAGGNVRTSGKKGDGTDWVIAVQNPEIDSDDSYVDTIDLADSSMVTSGVYRRFFEYQGKQYHHIINPDTLMPENNFLSVSIITKDSGWADAYSTAVFNMTIEKGMEFIESMPDTEAMWILPDRSKVKSSGWISRED